jgi:hypothetical protein
MIKLTITTKAGTTVSLDIPEVESIEAENNLTNALSGVVYQDDIREGLEGPFPAHHELLQSSGKRYKSVEDLIASRSVDEILARENVAGEKMEEGEVGGEEGVRQGEEGEVEVKEEEKPEQIPEIEHTENTPLELFQFPCKKGIYTPPPELIHDFILTFGKDFVRKQFLKSRLWLVTEPKKRKTFNGMKRYLTGWLNRHFEDKDFFVKVAEIKKTGSLLDNGNQDSQGW